MRPENPRPIFFWAGVAVLTLLLAGLARGSALLPGDTSARRPPTQAPTAAAAPEPAPGPLLADWRGFISLAGPDTPATIRRETASDQLASLRGHGFAGSVSGTGRRVAYWVTTPAGAQDLRVFDVTAPDQDTPLTTLLPGERGTAAVWSSDRGGVAVSVEASAGGGAETQFSALRVVDTPTRSIREIARLSDGDRFVPVGWDRGAQLVGACIAAPDGTAVAYDVVGEDAQSARTPMEPGIAASSVQSNGSAVLAIVNGTVVRVWTIGSYGDHRELGARPDERIAFARWKPGGTGIVVSIADRLEVWPSQGGDHRLVASGLPAAADLLVSTDGAIAVLSFDSGRSAVAVDLASGRAAAVPMAGERVLAAISFRG